MKEIVPVSSCFGCGICERSCLNNAISMNYDNEGFLRYSIDEYKCIDCDFCNKVCGSYNSNCLKNPVGQAFGAYITDDEIRNASSSGGVFTAFARSIIQNDGLVFGAASVNNYIRHIKAENEEELVSIRGSKYVQSDIRPIFEDLFNAIDSGRFVLFVGTPCQCSSIKAYCSAKAIDLSNTFIVDFICHGVCSPMIFDDYIKFYNKRNKSTVSEHKFRVKNNGWEKHTEENVLLDGNRDSYSYDSQVFKSLYHSRYAIRDTCYSCGFSSLSRVSDITMADFWGLKESKPDFYDENGVSFLLINTEKGKQLFSLSKSQLFYFDADIKDTEQPQLYDPCPKPHDRDSFWDKYAEKGFDGIAEKYFHTGKIRRILSRIYRVVIGKQ